MIIYSNDRAKEKLLDAISHARKFPRSSKSRASFLRSIRNLNRLKKNGRGELMIFWDFCQYSFCWQASGMYGGFIFHSYANEWAVHT